MNTVKKRAYAKINLHLDMVAKLDDGYHEVRTVMQSVSLYDEVELSIQHGVGIELFCDKVGVPLDCKNLAWRAAQLILSKCNIEKKVSIKIEKKIPMAGGLAGGSADAAAVLCALNEALGSPVGFDELLLLGASLGADVPFCMVGGTAFADGRGDVLHPFLPLPDCYIVISQGGEGASTPWAYSELDVAYGNFADGIYEPKSIEPLKQSLKEKDLSKICGNLYNIFESTVLTKRPVAQKIKNTMLEGGALGSMMSGSGTSIFGIFDSRDKAENTVSAIEKLGYDAYLCRPVGNI